MTERDIRRLLTAYRAGERSEEETVAALAKASYENLGFARVDHSRELRQGFPEVVYAAGKTKEQLLAILQSLAAASDGSILATRASGEQYAFVHPALPEARYDEAARAIYLRREPPLTAPPQDESHEILIITAGTSDIPVAAEARLTAELYGNRVRTLYDCGVAGIHRLLAQEEIIRRARVIIAIAGMEGALASVVGGMAQAPVIAVPTSIGYGASFSGVTALLSMLSSCAAGVSVVNIDNGFGAGVLASKINALS
jgi:NCAIR mutase (PurE)-related protein